MEAKASSETLSSVVWIKTIGEQHGQQLFVSKKEILFPQETEIPTWCHMPIKYILWVRWDINLEIIVQFDEQKTVSVKKYEQIIWKI